MSRTQNGPPTVPCQHCPLAGFDHFRRFDAKELEFISSFKTGELKVDAGASILVEGAHSGHLYTVLSGWLFRHKNLPDGRRQVLNYALPGDLVGLQGSVLGEMQHSIETLTPATLCVFEKDRLPELFQRFPELAYDVTWLASREECILDEALLSVGRRSAEERSAYLLAFLHHRAKEVRLLNGKHTIPVTQQHVADTLGLSIVHTNKTLRKLANKGLIEWLDRGCRVTHFQGLCDIAGWEPGTSVDRPFI